MVDRGHYDRPLSTLLVRLLAQTLFLKESPTVSAPRVRMSIEPSIDAEAVAFSIGRERLHAEVSVVGPTEDLKRTALLLRPHHMPAPTPG